MLTTKTYDLTDEEYLKHAGELSNKYVSAFAKLSQKEKSCRFAANILVGLLFAYMVVIAVALKNAHSVAVKYQYVMIAAAGILWALGIATVIVIQQSRQLKAKAAKIVCVSLIRKYKYDGFGYDCEIELPDGKTTERHYGVDLVAYDLAEGQIPYVETFFNDVIKVNTIVHIAK